MNSDKSFPVFDIIYHIFAIPYNFFIGFLVGLAAPVAAIAAVVAGIRLLTGKVPFLNLEEGEAGERYLSLKLVPPDEVSELFDVQKEKIGDDLVKMQTEIKAIVEETRAEAQQAVQEEAAPEEAV